MIQEGEDRIVQLFRLLHLEPLDPECLRQSSEVGQGGAVALGVALVVDELLPLAHHPHPLVVEDEDLDGELVLGGGGELLDVHHDRGLAGDIHDEGLGMGGLDADGGGEAVAHRPQSAGGHPPVGLVEADVLGGPHLVLADLAGEVGVPALRERIQAHDRMLRLDRARGGLAVGEAIPPAPRGDLPPPAREGLLLGGEAALLPAALKGGKRIAGVSDDAHIHEDVLVDAARINVDVDLARIGGEGGGLARHPIVKARPNAEHRVRTVHGEIGLIRAVHPDHPEEERVVGGEGPEPHEGAGDGKAQLAREGGEAAGGMGPRVDHPAAEIDDRPLGAAQDIKGGVYGVRVGAQAREARRAVSEGLGRAVEAARLLDIFRQIHKHRARTPAGGDGEGLVEDARQVGDIAHEVVVLGASPGDTGRVGLLEGVVADEVGRHLARETDQGNRVHQGIGEAGDRVGRPRPGGDEHAADLAGAPRIALGGMDGGLLVAHQDVAQAVEAVEHVVDRQHRPAGVAEYMLHPVVHHGAEHHLRADHLLARLLEACIPFASTRAQSGGGKRRGSRRAGGGGARPAPPVAGAAGVLEAGRHGRLGGAEGGRGQGRRGQGRGKPARQRAGAGGRGAGA